ncbi:MAG TPA: hypothetical protein VG122_02030 [Gemmata sp.]|nr:hypothetical protein [Gemmata sp.]
MVQTIICKGKRYTGIGLDDIALIQLLHDSNLRGVPRDVIERLDAAGLIDLVDRSGKTVWALTTKGRLRAQAVAPLESQLRRHFASTHTSGGCGFQTVNRCGFTMAPKSRRMS